MTVLVLTAVAPGLRGLLTRWLMEIQPGVFADRVSRRVRERIWEQVRTRIGDGQAVLIFPARNEQGFQVCTAGLHRWTPVAAEGLTLMLRGQRPRPVTAGGLSVPGSTTRREEAAAMALTNKAAALWAKTGAHSRTSSVQAGDWHTRIPPKMSQVSGSPLRVQGARVQDVRQQVPARITPARTGSTLLRPAVTTDYVNQMRRLLVTNWY